MIEVFYSDKPPASTSAKEWYRLELVKRQEIGFDVFVILEDHYVNGKTNKAPKIETFDRAEADKLYAHKRELITSKGFRFVVTAGR